MPQNPDHYAIVIGIDFYPQLRALKAAEQDATKFALWLTKEAGGSLPSRNVKFIKSMPSNSQNPSTARPLQAEVDDALIQFGIRKKERIGKRLYFYFSGHGIGPKFDEVGMLMANASMDQLVNSLGLRPYRSFFRDSEAFDEVVFILDCCRDPRGDIQPQNPTFNPYKKGDGTKIQDLVILGATYGEESYQPLMPGTKDRRGLLTQALLEGLEDPRWADGLGRFTSESLSYYIMSRVPILASEADVNQTPNIDTTLKTPIIFSTIPTSELELVPVQIIAPPGLKGELVLSDSFNSEILRTTAATSIGPTGWVVHLVRTKWYQVKLVPPPQTPPKPNLIDLTEFNGTTYVHQFKP